MNIYMLVKYNNIYEEIVEIHMDNEANVVSGELESLRNNYALKRHEGMRWKIEIINIKEW